MFSSKNESYFLLAISLNFCLKILGSCWHFTDSQEAFLFLFYQYSNIYCLTQCKNVQTFMDVQVVQTVLAICIEHILIFTHQTTTHFLENETLILKNRTVPAGGAAKC